MNTIWTAVNLNAHSVHVHDIIIVDCMVIVYMQLYAVMWYTLIKKNVGFV